MCNSQWGTMFSAQSKERQKCKGNALKVLIMHRIAAEREQEVKVIRKKATTLRQKSRKHLQQKNI